MDAEHQTQASRRCHTRGHLPLLDPLRRIRLYGMRAFRGKKTPSCQRLFPALTSGRSIPATLVEESPVFALPPCGLRPDVHAETNSHLWHACFPGSHTSLCHRLLGQLPSLPCSRATRVEESQHGNETTCDIHHAGSAQNAMATTIQLNHLREQQRKKEST